MPHLRTASSSFSAAEQRKTPPGRGRRLSGGRCASAAIRGVGCVRRKCLWCWYSRFNPSLCRCLRSYPPLLPSIHRRLQPGAADEATDRLRHPQGGSRRLEPRFSRSGHDTMLELAGHGGPRRPTGSLDAHRCHQFMEWLKRRLSQRSDKAYIARAYMRNTMA